MNSKKYIKLVLLLVVAVGVGIIGTVSFKKASNSRSDSVISEANKHVTFYKSPNCGCCGNHAAYLKSNGFDVEIIDTEDLDSVKEKHNIPAGKESCHTALIGDYVVEGHMPVEAIKKLLTEKPAVKGIGMAGMPSGSPGMPGVKRAPFEIYSFSENGNSSSYINL